MRNFLKRSTKRILGGWTLRNAARYGRADIARYLLDAGSNPNEVWVDKDPGRPAERFTPLLITAMNGSADVARLLVERGANLNTRLVSRFGYDDAVFPGDNALFVATSYNHTNVVEVLLNAGADVQSTDPFGESPLHIAAMHDHADTAKLLISRGANIMALNKYNLTPLHIVAIYGNPEVTTLLLRSGADPMFSPTIFDPFDGPPSPMTPFDLASKLLGRRGGKDVDRWFRYDWQQPLFNRLPLVIDRGAGRHSVEIELLRRATVD